MYAGIDPSTDQTIKPDVGADPLLPPLLPPTYTYKYRPSWLPPYVGGRLHTPAAKAVQTAFTAVAASAAASSLAKHLSSAAAAATPVPSPKLLSALSLAGVRRSLQWDEGSVGATVLAIARPVLVVATPAALSALIAVKA